MSKPLAWLARACAHHAHVTPTRLGTFSARCTHTRQSKMHVHKSNTNQHMRTGHSSASEPEVSAKKDKKSKKQVLFATTSQRRD